MNSVHLDLPHSHGVLAALRRMAAAGRVRTSSALPKLETLLGLSRLDVSESIRELYRAGLVQYQADVRQMPVSGFITVTKEVVEVPDHERSWTQAIMATGFADEAGAVLDGLSSKLVDMSPEDMNHLAMAIKRVGEVDSKFLDDAGFNVSARHVLGGSKVLSQLSVKMLQVLGLPARLHNSSPRYVICAGPASPSATLLIENPRAFENAVRSGLCSTVALVCTFGFGLSYLGQEWLHGKNVSEHDKPIVIVRAGSPPGLGDLLTLNNVFLWADLDLAAFDIFRSLRSAIPHLRLSKIYESMVPLLADPVASHPYAVIFDKSGQAGCEVEAPGPSTQEDQSVQALRFSCRNRAVDQEAVDDSTILRLGPYPFA